MNKSRKRLKTKINKSSLKKVNLKAGVEINNNATIEKSQPIQPLWSWFAPTTVNPFIICPNEIRCMIVDYLVDSKDVFNIFEAYPELVDLMKYKRHLYLFDQVVPLIAEWLGEKDLLICRQVSKQWCHGVDNFLENHPSLRAYSHEKQETGQIWGLKDFSKCFHGPTYHHHEYQFSRSYFPTSFVFDSPQKFTRFLTDMKSHSTWRNPIVGRNVKFYPHDGSEQYASVTEIEEFWAQAFAFLKVWGHHIWFISIWGCKHQDHYNFFQTLKECLHLVPNLKSLEVNSAERWISRRNYTSLLQQTRFPPLPQLETLKFDFWFRTLGDALISHYSRQIRRFVICPGWDWQWKPEWGQVFPNLTELEIVHPSSLKGHPSWLAKIASALLPMNLPQLHWLHLELPPTRREEFKTDELCRLIRPFPRLTHFRLADTCQTWPRGLSRAKEPVTSLKSLSLHDSAVSSKFLLSFPSLTCLEIRFGTPHHHQERVQRKDPVRTFQEYIQNGSLANVWIVLPKLKTLILVNECNSIMDRFCKRKFDKYLRGIVEVSEDDDGNDLESSLNDNDEEDA